MATPKKGSKAAKAKMAKVRAAIKRKKSPAKKRKSAIVTERQIPVKWTNAGDGYLYQYNKDKDRAKKGAKRPGKRISKDGNVYYEYRVNRSDKSGSLTGAINAGKKQLLDNMFTVYGNWQSALLKAKTKADKNVIKKRISEIKRQINKLK